MLNSTYGSPALRHKKSTAVPRAWQRKFLAALRKSPDVSQAARAARIHRSTCYRHREENLTFARAWDEAIDESLDRLEAVAYRRAEEGDSQILMWLLRCHRPERYAELQRHQIGVAGGIVLIPAKAKGSE